MVRSASYHVSTLRPTYANSISLRSRQYHDLRLVDVKKLHRAMQNYNAWVENAPDSYKTDNFLATHVPITITSRYGQNQPLGTNTQETLRWWAQLRDFTKLRFICIAIATDIGSVMLILFINSMLTLRIPSLQRTGGNPVASTNTRRRTQWP